MNPRTKRRIILSTAVAGTLTAVVAGGLIARSWHRADQLADKRRDGLALFAERRFAEAIEPLAVAARNNDDVEAVLALAECRMRVPEANGRHMVTAAAYFRAVLARDEQNLRAMRGLLEAYVTLGRLPEIGPLARRVLAAAPNDVRAREIELEVLNLTGKFADAAAKARELQELEPANMRWRAAEILSLDRAGADATGRLTRVQDWRRDPALANEDGLVLLEAELLREIGKAEDARAMLRQLASRGVSARRTLEALIAAIESGGFEGPEREKLVEQCLATSRTALASAADASQVEGERLLRSGRLEEIERKFAAADPAEDAIYRLRFAGLYLAGRTEDALTFAREHAGKGAASEFRLVTRALCEGSAARARVDQIAGPSRICPKDPITAVILADVLLEAGEFDEAQGLLLQSYESTGEGYQPVGVRAVRASIALGRVRDAFRIAEDLLVRFGAGGDPMVAMLAVEAWAAALEANYQPTTRGGVYGTDSPESLRRLWASLSGAGSAHGPAALAPAVADVFIARGDRQTAKEILEHAVSANPKRLGEMGSARLSQALSTAASLDASLQGALIGQLGADQDGTLAAIVAERLVAQGEREAAIRVIDKALEKATATEQKALTRLRRPLANSEGITAWLVEELRNDRTLDTATFVLSRPEAWAGTDSTLATDAIGVMREALGAESIRVVVAEAAVTLTFHAGDRARLAASIAALDAAAQRSPDATSVLTTLAALFERQSPPQYDRSAKLLQRAADAEPGSVGIYPQLVNALQQSGDFDGAERALEAYVRLVGEDLQSKRAVADFKVRQGQLAEAAQIREQVVGRSKEVVDTIALARIRQKMGDMRTAESLLIQLRDGMVARATSDVVAADPSELGRMLLVERELALVYARDGRMEEARTSLSRAVARLGAGRVDEIRANVELAYGDLDIALELATAIVGRESTASNQLLLARTCIRTGDYRRARAALIESLTKDPESGDATTVAAALLLGDPDGRGLLDRNLAAASGRRPDLAATLALLDGSTSEEGRIVPDETDLTKSLELTTEHSGSPLVWRVAAHMHLLAERRDDAFRIAQRALARLPGDPTVGKLATDMAIAANRVDEASSAALAWKKMATAESFDVDVARASIELMQRRPEAGFQILRPIAREILQRAGDESALDALIACATLGGGMNDLSSLLSTLPRVRRVDVARRWIETARALEANAAVEAVRSALALAPEAGQIKAMATSSWTELCASGATDACALASSSLATLTAADAPVDIMTAELLSARGETDAAMERYRAVYVPALEAAAAGSSKDLAAVATRVGSDAAFAQRLGVSVIPVLAMHSAAECLLRAKRTGAEATALAAIASRMLPDSPDARDTFLRALIVEGRFPEASTVLADLEDPTLSAVCAAELALARGDSGEARRAVSRAEARMQVTAIPARTLRDRLRRLQDGVGGTPPVSKADSASGEGAAGGTEP